ncbi:hypothetical protein BDV96DRAFT_651986 [Lophiotrema nucula]|uniref:REJ domain-containing protein n=1 Tax=Lophiotrema nucula TaxID=690887 RepID=A0A6A5YTZ0_9PLEO|nr:hypothetical protein BDV96DRAFT_651986 [Lophiotrema nucula]
MPALTIPSPTDSPASPVDSSSHSDRSDRKRSASASSDRPPVSPITPTVTAAQLASTEPTESRARVPPPENARFMRQPPAVSISESENPDAIALRSAISLLQLQREKSRRDIKALEELKNAAVSDPQGFARSLRSQQAHKPKTTDALTPTLSDIASPALATSDEGERNGLHRKDSAGADPPNAGKEDKAKFSAIPQPQNIIRCPPVNWAKYHVVGGSLDKLHEEQRQYPFMPEPPKSAQGGRGPPHSVAAPYSPFTDGIGEGQARPSSKKRPS